MKQQHLTEFYLEQLQPTWLSTKRLRMLYAWINRLVSGLVSGLVAGLVLALVDGLNTRLEQSGIQVIEALNWSWKNLRRGPPIDLIFGLAFWLVVGVGIGQVRGLVSALIGALIFGLIRGLSATQIDEHMRIHPNQGIRTSGWNALRFGSVSGLACGLACGLAFGLNTGLNMGLNIGLVV